MCLRCNKLFTDPECEHETTLAEVTVGKKGSATLNEVIEAGDYVFKVTNPATDGTGTATLLEVADLSETVVIPSTVELKGSIYKINRISSRAFYKDTVIKTLFIGANVTVIDSYAFYGCSNLVKVSGGANLITIGSNAFACCSKLKSFAITSKLLAKIGPYCFYKDSKLKTIYIKNTTKLTKSSVKKSLKGSKVKTVKVKKSKVKKYKKYFTKKNAGRKVKVKK